jgi:ribosome biogenesis GTPase A
MSGLLAGPIDIVLFFHLIYNTFMENLNKAIQWYPGHMAKARRQMGENIKRIDAVLEVVDARIPYSSSNPDFEGMFQSKMRLAVLNKSDMADNSVTKKWLRYYQDKNIPVLAINATNKGEKKKLIDFITRSLNEKIKKSKNRGYKKSLRLMVAGIPNSGKSTIINMLAPRASAKTSNRPGVTRGQQMVRISDDIELVDTPGVLWPKFEEEKVGLHLALTGAIKDDILDKYTLATELIRAINALYPKALGERFGIETEGIKPDLLIEEISQKRGLLLSGGRLDTERGSAMLLTEFRAGKLGRISLESPDD